MGFLTRLTTVNDWSFWQHQRDLLTAGMLVPACGQCPARSGEWCDPGHMPPAEMVLIDADPPHLIHSARLAAAADSGHLNRKTMIAQFAGGPVSAGLTQPATAKRKRK